MIQVLLSLFLEKGGNQYLVVVNKDFRNVMNLAIDVDGSVSRVLKDGSTVSPDGSTIAVEPGIWLYLHGENEKRFLI